MDAVAGFLRDVERIGRPEEVVLSLGVVPAAEAAMRSMAASNKLPSVSSLLVSVEICVANGLSRDGLERHAALCVVEGNNVLPAHVGHDELAVVGMAII